MPELAAVYAIGTLSCLLCTGLFLFLWWRKKNSSATLILNSNLKKIGLFWSDHQDGLREWKEEAESHDWAATRRSVLLAGGLFSGMSWFGLLLLLILMISVRTFARSRLEKRLYSSRLARDRDLSNSDIERAIDEAKAV